MPQIWSDTYLNQVLTDAAHDIVSQVNCLYHRFYLATTSGTPVYTLPEKVKGIKRITWRGKELTPVSWMELEAIAPGQAFVSSGVNVEGTASVPLFYALHPTNILDIKFYPTPNETLSNAGGDPLSPTPNEARCTISCWRAIDDSIPEATLPGYINRRTRKSFALWRAYGKEGIGQNTKASIYYKNRYKLLIELFHKINSGAFLAIQYQLNEGLPPRGRKPAKPVLPPNFEQVTF